jgi:hypothetical protein
MTKISMIILGAGALGVLGITALPLASYATDVELEITVKSKDDTSGATGGNNAKGYTWNVKDPDVKVNLGTAADALGVATGGIAPVASAADFTTASATAEYGVKFTPVTTSGGPTITDTVGTYLAISNTDQVIGKTATSGSITAWPAGAIVDPAQGTYFGTTTEGGTNSTIALTAHWDSSLAVGTYKNTITISQTNNT